MNGKFIITNSVSTAKELTNAGYKLINKTDESWFFVNDNKLTFSKGNVTYTNKLHI